MDLFYRVAVTSVHIPPLRERISDIPLLADFYLERLAQQHGVRKGVLLPGTLDALQAYSWPGNIREFRNVIESMLLTAPDHILGDECLPPEVLGRVAMPGESPSRQSVAPQAAAESSRLEDAERDAILKAIRSQGGNMAAVARSLGIAKSTLYLKLKRFELDSLVDSVRSRT